ncbi:MAG: ABC transporter ATP-binding protein, partial [Candidatus Adiutrix sp.]
MMHKMNISVVDDDVTRPIKGGDLKLLKRLTPQLKPLKLWILAGAVLVFLAAIASVALPFVTKLAIDRYIVPIQFQLTLPPDDYLPEPIQKIMAQGFTQPSGLAKIMFVNPKALSVLNRSEENFLFENGFLSREKFYIHQIGADDLGALKLSASNQTIIHYPKILAIAEKDLAKLPENIVLALRGSDISGLKSLALAFAFLMLLAYAFEFGQRVIMEIATQRFAHNLRQSTLKHLFGLSQSFFDRNQSARLTSRVTNDINNLSNLAKTTVATLFNDIVSLLLIIIIMFSLSPKMALIAVSFTPLTVWLSIYFGRKSRLVQRELRARLAIINQSFAETIGGLNIIQAFRREAGSVETFKKLNFDNYLAGLKQVKIHSIFVPLIDIFASVILALIIWFGGGDVLAGTVSLGVIAAFVGYARRFFMPIQDMAEKINIFQSAFASLERLTELMDEKETLNAPQSPLCPIQ